MLKKTRSTHRPLRGRASKSREGGGDKLFDRAVDVVQRDRKANTSYLQRRLQFGDNRAATLIEKMEKAGIISEANAAGKRDILVDVIDED